MVSSDMLWSRNVVTMLGEAFSAIRSQPLNREQRAAVDEIAIAATILADLPVDARRAAVAALVELDAQHAKDRPVAFYVD